MNEALATSANGTQSADMGLWKKFCTNLVNVAIPNLIASDLVITKPMSSMSGYITYVKYSVATDKGQSWNGQEFNSPFALSKDGFDANFTSQAVVENVAEGATDLTPVWTPVVKEAFEDAGVKYDVKVVHADGTFTFANLDAAGKVTGLVAGDKVAYKYDNVVIPQNDLPRIKAEMKSIPLVAKARRVAIELYVA